MVIGLVLSFGGGYYVNRNIADSKLQKTNTELKDNLDKIQKALPELEEVRSFEGTVMSVGGNSIIIEIASSSNPFDQWSTTREVIITTETKILHRGVKSPDILKKEFEANKKISSPFLEESLSISDIKPGWKIKVEAAENIKMRASFEAVRILDDWPFVGLPLDLSTAVTAPIINPTTTPLNTALPNTSVSPPKTGGMPVMPTTSPKSTPKPPGPGGLPASSITSLPPPPGAPPVSSTNSPPPPPPAGSLPSGTLPPVPPPPQ